MDIISHAVFGILFAKQVSLQAIIGAVFPDLDRLYTYPKGKYFKHGSRTWFHELPFLSIVMAAAFFLGFPLFSLGLLSHIFLDFVTGSTRPFYPLSDKHIDFNLNRKTKIALGAAIWAIGAYYISLTGLPGWM
ncbi:MAG: metal-dependent hydrolase [Candidatus Aenigmarchaeota archaeon]